MTQSDKPQSKSTAQRIQQILANSAQLNRYAHNIHATFNVREHSAQAWQQWQDACKAFHTCPDDLFFPKGRANYQRMKAGDPAAIHDAVLYLYADPVHFRSGYRKESLWRRAPRWMLDDEGRTLIEQAALAYLGRMIRRDFWYMCRAMARMASARFWQDVETRLNNPDPRIATRASYLYQYKNNIEHGEATRRSVRRAYLMRRFGHPPIDS